MPVQNYSTKLQNGLTLVLQPTNCYNNKLNITFVFDGIGSGSDTKPGISHLCEHMVFRGTDDLSAKEVGNTLTYLSNGSYYAYTAYDKTVFGLNTDKNHLSDAVQLLVDMFNRSTLDGFETEKKVIKQELNLRLDNQYINLFNLIDLSHDIKNNDLTQKNHLPLISKNEAKAFIGDNYVPSKCTVIVSGAIDDVDITEAIFKSKTREWVNSKSAQHIWKELQYKPGYFHESCDSNSTYFSLFFKGAKCGNINDIVHQSIVNAISGYGLNSIMMYDARLSQGLTYDISTFNVIEKDHGVWGVISATDHESFPSLLKSAISSIKSLRSIVSNPGKNNIDIAKLSLKESINKPILTPAEASGQYMFYSDLGVTKEELIKIIDETNTKDVLSWLDGTLASGPSLAVYGDIGENSYSHEIVTEMWNNISI